MRTAATSCPECRGSWRISIHEPIGPPSNLLNVACWACGTTLQVATISPDVPRPPAVRVLQNTASAASYRKPAGSSTKIEFSADLRMWVARVLVLLAGLIICLMGLVTPPEPVEVFRAATPLAVVAFVGAGLMVCEKLLHAPILAIRNGHLLEAAHLWSRASIDLAEHESIALVRWFPRDSEDSVVSGLLLCGPRDSSFLWFQGAKAHDVEWMGDTLRTSAGLRSATRQEVAAALS